MKRYLFLFISIIVISMLCAFQTETQVPADDSPSTETKTSAGNSNIYNIIMQDYYHDTELIGKKQPVNNQRLTDTLSEYQDKEHKL